MANRDSTAAAGHATQAVETTARSTELSHYRAFGDMRLCNRGIRHACRFVVLNLSGGLRSDRAMFIRVKKIGPYEYLYLVENAREGGRHVQRVIKALGRRDASRTPICSMA